MRILVGILAVLIAANAAHARPYYGGTRKPSFDGDHFDYVRRCTDESLPPEKRIAYCRHMIGNGAGTDGDDATWILIAGAMRDEGKFSEALAIFGQVSERLPSSAPWHSLAQQRVSSFYAERGVTYAVAGQYERALADANKLLDIAPDEAGSYNHRCWIRAIAGKELESAQTDCDEALKREPHLADAFDSRGLVRFKLNELQAALQDFKSALDEDGNAWGSLFLKGVVEKRLGDAKTGNADIAKALEHNPNLTDVYSRYGVKQTTAP